MARELIYMDGEKVVGREDTVKAIRGVNWALISVAAMILLTGALFIFFAMIAWSDGDVTAPVQPEREAVR